MQKKEWYLEYEIEINRPGLLGDVSSLLGMLGISIVTINGVDQGKRGLLIKTDNLEKVERFEQIARSIDEIEITKLKSPNLEIGLLLDTVDILNKMLKIRKRLDLSVKI